MPRRLTEYATILIKRNCLTTNFCDYYLHINTELLLTFKYFKKSDLHLNKIVEMRPKQLSGNQISFFDILHITPLDVEQALDGVDINSQAGSDCIPNIFLKHCKQSLSVALALIFNRSLDQGVVLPEWRESFLTPIHKKGPKHQIENYRDIAKLSAIPKIFEKIVKDKIYVLISQHISTHQHGFIAGKSTITNLASFTNYVWNPYYNVHIT